SLGAVNGLVSFTNLSHNVATTISIDFANSGLAGATSASVVVSPSAFSKLQLLAPGETAAPGTASGKSGTPNSQSAATPFSVTVNAADPYWNIVNTNDTVAITSSDLNAALPASAALVSGAKSLSVTLKTAGSATLTASDITHPAIQNSTTPPLAVVAGPLAKLQLLVPGEIAAPGTSTGKSGAPTAQTAGTAFSVTVNGVDANWNLVTNATDTVGLTSSDSNASLPANGALLNGTGIFNLTLKTAGNRTVTATDVTDGTRIASTSPSVTVNPALFAKLQLLVPGETAAPGTAAGKSGAPLAEVAGSAFNVTVNATDPCWNVVNTNDTVAITSSDLNAALPGNAALISGTNGFSVTLKTAGSQTLTVSDTTLPSIASATEGPFQVLAGAPNKLTLSISPPTAATAGVVFAPQPAIRVEDAAGNLVRTDNGRSITATRGVGSSTLQGSLTATTVNGLATFTNVAYNMAETITINFTANGLTSATSGNVLVSPTTVTQLAFNFQPGGISRTGSRLA
ncbi:MAG TPA: hypothetical protein VEO53_11750, partial [Candidatus Binatia bacterium]|nr:hypothetical protein [Candidatus Binatia bacterium]